MAPFFVMQEAEKTTPMFAQYLGIKKNYPDALLFFRMGDFYELFFDDALIASRELQIVLTQRGKDGARAAPMCGVPWYAAQSYIATLVDKGFSIAVCEQTEDPKAAKGIVKRAVTQVITPGTVLDDLNLEAGRHNFLGSVFVGESGAAFAWADVSTGEWSGLESRRPEDIWQWVGKLAPAELLVPQNLELPKTIGNMRKKKLDLRDFDDGRASAALQVCQGVRDLASLGLDDKPLLARACGALLRYLHQTQPGCAEHLLPFVPLDVSRCLIIDDLTERNLEIFQRLNGQKGKGTLRHVVDHTVTPMGGRHLEDMLRKPFRDAAPILGTQQAVIFLHDDDKRRASLRKCLETVSDIERITTRICLNRCRPADFIALRQSLAILPQIRQLLSTGKDALPPVVARLLSGWDDLEDAAKLLQDALVDEPPNTVNDGGIFRTGFNAALDELLRHCLHGEEELDALLEKERAETGIQRLKMGFNRVFGYYYEVGKNQDLPERFIRRQTLANGERFTTEELKSLESKILNAEEQRKQLEYDMYQDLRDHIARQRDRLMHMAALLGHVDYWQGLAECGRRNVWAMPELSDKSEIQIEEGRHPVVESIIGRGNFVPNDLRMDESRRLCLLTGPNMAGKSTILRQAAIICILAQMGSMAPVKSAVIGLCDRLFSRVGASDNLAQGQSTFMVEMMETARILRQATRRSLVILDEIGRGTSTYDGVALAWAVVENLAGRAQGQLRTLFATHYHELTALENCLDGIFTMNIAIRESNGEILFLHKLIPGPADKSYGVEVARLAGVPYPVVQRARVILQNLEKDRSGARARVFNAASLSLPGLEHLGAAKSADAKLDALGKNPAVKKLLDLAPENINPDLSREILAALKKALQTAIDKKA